MSRVPYELPYLGKKHWQVMKRIFRYLKGTTDIGVVCYGDTSCALAGYSDSDYATDLDAKRSMTGYTFTIGHSLVNWKETLQPTVALSTTEVEYMAMQKQQRKELG